MNAKVPREVLLATKASRLLEQVRALLGPLRAAKRGSKGGRRGGGGGESWDTPLREALAARPTEPDALLRWRQAHALWEELVALWWQLALHRTADIVRAEARAAMAKASQRYREEDLQQSGYMGAFRAAQTWSPGGRAAWRTYAASGIRMLILRHLREGATEYVHIGSTARVAGWRMLRIRRELDQQGIRLSRADIAELAQVPLETAEDVDQAASLGNIVHLDALRARGWRSGRGDGEETDSHDLIGGEAPEYDEALDYDEKLGIVLRALHRLPNAQRELLAARIEGLSLRDLSERYGVTKERVRQREGAALAALAKLLGRPPLSVSPFSSRDSGEPRTRCKKPQEGAP